MTKDPTFSAPVSRAAPERDLLAQKRSATRPLALAHWFGKREERSLVTYCASPLRDPLPQEKRRDPRRRTRLRAGKILDRANRFLVEAAIIDRSCGGVRLRLARDVALPELFHFYDEESEAIFLTRIAWRRRHLIGARRGPLVAATLRQLIALRGRYYAMSDD